MKRFFAALVSSRWPATLLIGTCLAAPSMGMQTQGSGQETVWDQLMAAQAARDLRSGAEYMEIKQYDRAVREFSKAAIAHPSDPASHMMLGAAYYWSGQVDQAASEFQETLRLDPKNAQGHLLMGIVYAWKGDANAAYQEFTESEKYAPERPDVQMDLGSIEETLGKFDSALIHLRKAVRLAPSDPIYDYQLGLLYRHLGRDQDAVESMESVLRKNPDFEDALLELAAANERQGKIKEAQEYFHKAVKLKGRDAVARLRLGRAYLLNSLPAKARDVFQDAFHLTPDTASGLALSASFGGKPKESASQEPSDRPQPTTEPKDPLDTLARNLARIPLDQEAKLSVDMAFMSKPKLVRHREASALKRALEEAEKPSASPMGVHRSFTLPAGSGAERARQIEAILGDLREAAKKAPSESDIRLAMNLQFVPKSSASSNRGEGGGGGKTSPGTPPKASFNPHDVGNDMGLWVMGTGWIPLVEEVLPLSGEDPDHPDTPDWWITDGLAYATLGNGMQALESFNRALRVNPQDELALLGRAVAMVELGNEAGAIATYQRLLGIYPKNRAAQEGLKWLLKAPAK